MSYESGLHKDFDLFDGPEEVRGGPERYMPPTTPDAEIAARLEPGRQAQLDALGNVLCPRPHRRAQGGVVLAQERELDAQYRGQGGGLVVVVEDDRVVGGRIRDRPRLRRYESLPV